MINRASAQKEIQRLNKELKESKDRQDTSSLEKRMENARQELLQYANAHPDTPYSAYMLIGDISKSRHGREAFGQIGVRFAQEYYDIAQAALKLTNKETDNA